MCGTTFVAVTRRRSVLLLETIGRKTGKRRLTPVTYLVDGEDAWVIGGGAGGMTRVDWVANLRRQQETRVWIKRQELRVAVQELTGAERDAAYADASSRFPEVRKYEAVSGRKIPYFRLTNTTQSSRS